MGTKRKTKKEVQEMALKFGCEMRYSGKLKKWFRHRVAPLPDNIKS